MAFRYNAPMPDDPTNLSKDQMDAMLGRVSARIFAPGQRVRVHCPRSERLNGLTGTVRSATADRAWIRLDPEGVADPGADPEEFLFSEEELVPIREAQEQDMDAPGPYMVALDYISPLRELGYGNRLAQHTDRAFYVKHYNAQREDAPYVFKGDLSVLVEPEGAAAVISINYRSDGESVRIQDVTVPAIDVIDIVREIELLVCDQTIGGITEFTDAVREKHWPGSQVMGHDEMLYTFGESVMESGDDADINFDAYAKDSAGYNPVQLLTSKEIRAMVKAAGYKVDTLYRSKRTTGWEVSAVPMTDEVLRLCRANYEEEKYRAEKVIWDKLKERFPGYDDYHLGLLVYFHVWNWNGMTSANLDNPRNYTLHVTITPHDANQRKQGLPPVKEGVSEPTAEPDPDLSFDATNYAKTTFEPSEFLRAGGWEMQLERADYEYWRKEFPLPRNYILGGMTFDQFVAQLGFNTRNSKTTSVDVNIFFNNREQKFGLPVKGWRLEPQMLSRPENIHFDDEKHYDATMTLRRFALGIGQVLANTPWPNGNSALAASSAVERAVAVFAHELNDRAENPAYSDQVNETFDPDAPDSYVSSLGTVAHVAARFGMRLEGRTKWVREIRLKHPMEVWVAGPRQWLLTVFRVILDWNPEEGSAGWAELALRARGDDPTRTILIWHASACYRSEAAAALHLNEAMSYFFQAIEDDHEPHQYKQLKEILQMGVGPFMIKVEGEDEDPD